MSDGVEVRRLGRAEAADSIGELARLRIEVFRAFPYLYDGDAGYERKYLQKYLASPGAVIVGAFDGCTMVGAATAAPLLDHFDEFAGPFRDHDLDPAKLFYFGESVLRQGWRGRSVGVRFFEEREKAALEQGFSACVFSAVVRPPDHPARPAGYAPLDAFWKNRGYARLPGLLTYFSWKDVGAREETGKPMEYWWKRISPSPK